MVTAIIMEENENLTEDDELVLDSYKPTGKNRVLVVGKVDGVPENRHNVELLLDSLKLPELNQEIEVVCDLKLVAIIIGIQTSSAMFGCPYGECVKIDEESNEMTNKRGIYKTGSMRTCNSIIRNQKAWMKATNGDRSSLKLFKNCEFEPMKLRNDQGDQEIIFMFPPDPLHINYLGPVNDALEMLEKMYPIEMKEEFYKRHNMKKSGQGAGGKFNGPSIKYVLKENFLLDLESTLPTFAIAKDFTDYLRTIREVHKVCTSKMLDKKGSKTSGSKL